MSPSKLLPLLLPIYLITVTTAYADSQRTLFAFENKFPRWEQIEVGATYTATQDDNGFVQNDLQVASPYIRYGIRENFSLQIDVPFVNSDPSFADSESGLGDASIELALRTWEDIFGYPYFIPHVRVTLPTGDEDKGLGNDDSVVEVGLSYGDNITNRVSYVLDFTYRVNPEVDNQLLLANSYILEYSKDFALLAEILYEEEIEDGADSSVLFVGGMSYNWTPNLQMGAHIGGGITGDTDVYSQVRFSYSF